MTKQLASLEYGAFAYPYSKVLFGDWSKTYGDAIRTIYERANYNATWKNVLPFQSDYAYDDVEQIMETYAALVIDKKIPPLVKNVTEEDHNTIVKTVTKESGRREDLVRVVLYEAYWAAYGKGANIPVGMLTIPDKIKSEKTSQDPLDTDLWQTLKFLGILGAGAFVFSRYVSLKEITSKS